MSQSISAQKLNENRRNVDDKIRLMEQHQVEQKKILLMSNFEQDTTNKIERRLRADQYNKLTSQVNANLFERKKQLAALYNAEMAHWKASVLNKVETVEDRKKRIKDKAFALKEARDTASQELIKKCLDLQWRDSCDDARLLDSRAMTRFMARERQRQIEERKNRNQSGGEEEEKLLAQLQKEADKLNEKENMKVKMQHDAALATQDAIARQIAENQKQRDDRFNRKMQEDQTEIASIKKSIEDEAADQNRRKMDEYLRGKDVMAYNEQYKGLRAQEAAMDAQENAILLDYALRKEREQIAKEEAKKQAAKNAALKFKKYLEEQMQREAEDNQWVDEVRKKEEEKVWKARDDVLKAREDARNYLMQQVTAGRQEQIRFKQEMQKLEKDHDIVYVEKFLKDAKEGVEMEAAAREERRKKAMDNSVKLMEQIHGIESRRDQEKQEVYLEAKRMEYIESMHRQKLQTQGGSVRLHRPLKESRWYS